jgi:arylsulfatase A-like enzyme
MNVTLLAPHLVYLLVDDLGFANVGWNVPAAVREPITPRIDALHATGATLSRFYTYRFCSPTRSSLMSGRLPYHVNQQNHPPDLPGGGVPVNMTLLPERLAPLGYVSHQVGKWHCGMSSVDRLPVSRGFASSFGYLSGAEDHYTNKRGAYVDLWRNASAAIGEEGGDYSNYKYTAEALRIIRAHPPEKKLFLYMAYADVHGPIQAPDNYTALYAGISNKQRRLCLAMISAVDTSIGWIVDELTAQGMYDSTLILWSSDNGGPSDHGNVCRGAA